MRRDPAALAARPFDVVVIGGGIYGAIAAWDATLRGLSVALIDRGDFGGGTSFNSAKTVHGGVRALQTGNVAALRRFARERRVLARLLPHLVRPLPFLIPTYRGIGRNRLLLRLYFAVGDRLTRAGGAPPGEAGWFPGSRVVSRDECLRLNPLIDPAEVTGGIEWFDSQMYNSDRVPLAFIASAVEAGAVAANHVEAEAALARGGALEGVRAADRITGEAFDIRARIVLNAAGPWAPELNGRLAPAAGGRLCRHLSKAMNLVIPSPLGGSHAVAGPAGGRLLFVAPWRDFAIVGTSHDRHAGDAGRLALERSELHRFLGAARAAFPNLSLALDDVRLVHRGLLPASPRGDGSRLATRSAVVDHRRDGVGGLISMLGVRFTTARDTAERAVDLVMAQLARPGAACRSASAPVAGGGVPDFDAFLRDAVSAADGVLPGTDRERVARTYGTRQRAVLDLLRASPGDRAPLGAACAVTAGEVRHAVREEMAVRLSDALLRRTEAGSAGHPGDEAVAAAARVMAGELGWTRERTAAEMDAVRRVYQLPA